MKEISELNLLEDVRYSEDHEWTRTLGDTIRIGISDYAQDQLGDVIFVELPQVGDRLEKGAEFGSIESVKAVSDLCAPLSGEVLSVNDALEEAPEQVNESCYQDGWLITLRLSDPSQLDGLLDEAAYSESVQERDSES